MKNKCKIIFIFCMTFLFTIIGPVSSITTSYKDLFIEKNSNNIYYSYDQFVDLLEQLQSQNPDIFSYNSIGTTYQDRKIWVVKISDNVTIDEDEPGVLFIGGIHGHEKPGYQVIIYTINSILENYSAYKVNLSFMGLIRDLVNNTELYFIPMANPDGIEANCRKNQRPNDCLFGNTYFRGVDINRNFGYKWDEFNRHPFKYAFGAFPTSLKRTNVMYPFLDFKSINGRGYYRGEYPFSENESTAIKSFIENHTITIVIDYHTTGELITYPWSWTHDPTPDEHMFLSIAGNISKINGYQITQGSKWYYILGCSKDWFYAEHGIYPLVIELCNASGSSAPQDKEIIINLCRKHLFVNLYVAERAIILASKC